MSSDAAMLYISPA